MTGLSECPPCALYRTCPYPAIFTAPPPAMHKLQRFTEVPNPYVIEPPPFGQRHVAAGELVSFDMVLIGRARAQLPLVAYAWQRAFGHGIGRARARGQLVDIALNNGDDEGSVWDAEAGRIAPHDAEVVVPPPAVTDTITLRITTPLRLQHQGHPVPPNRLRPRTLFTALLRRASLLFELHAGLSDIAGDAARLAELADRLADERRLEWQDWTRYSSRQQQQMTLGGVIGEWRLSGNLGELLPWFWLGQWLHVGKNATMGLGRYSLQW